jgi:diguanylate cyclase (GGDEF)-like protein
VISLLAKGLVFAGATILVAAFVPVRQLIVRLPAGPVRGRWYAMTAFIGIFLVGYLGYVVAFWDGHSVPRDLIAPAVFFLGACFVWLSALLSLQTSMDLMRIHVLEHETVTDALTGVFNRRYLDRRMLEELARVRRYGHPLSILLLDIDYFKQINDRYGHPVGDRVLVALAQIVSEEIREPDVLARYGGEEFLVIFPQTSLSGAMQIAERLRRRVEGHRFGASDLPEEADSLSVTTSIGVAELSDDVQDVERLLRAADAGLYTAKREGRNRVAAGKPDAENPGPAPTDA